MLMARGGLTRQCHFVVSIPFGYSTASAYSYLSDLLPCSRFGFINIAWAVEWNHSTVLHQVFQAGLMRI